MAPRYQLIKQYILHHIQTGDWPANYRLPSENQLSEQFSVSRMTARRALTELTESGILQRNQGLGTFVASVMPTGAALQIRSISDEIRERQHRHSARVMAHMDIRLDALQAAHLQLPVGAKAFFSRILHSENDLPIQLEERVVNPEWVPDYLHQDFTEESTTHYLLRQARLSIADHWIEAVLPTAEQAAWLAIERHQPCLKMSRKTFAAGQQVVNFAELYHPGHRYQLVAHQNFDHRNPS